MVVVSCFSLFLFLVFFLLWLLLFFSDEKVMRSACSATSALLHGSPMAQRVFLKHGGLSALSDCLSDYNVKIRSLALQSILIMIKGSRVSMNMSQNDRMKVVEEVRKDGRCSCGCGCGCGCGCCCICRCYCCCCRRRWYSWCVRSIDVLILFRMHRSGKVGYWTMCCTC